MSPTLERHRGVLFVALAALVTAVLWSFASRADAALTTATITGGNTGTLNFDGADDIVVVSVAGGNFVYSINNGAPQTDWDTSTPANDPIPADDTFSIVVNGGGGNDDLKVLALNAEIVKATINGDPGDDLITGADSNDDVNGGDGNDRIVGAKGADTFTGGNNNDTMVWNNGDGSDTMDGDGGNDAVEFNGAAVQGDVTQLATPLAGRVEFKRTNLVNITLNTTAERFEVNGLGGEDSLTVLDPAVAERTLLSFNGGAGNDTANGSEGADLLRGDEGNDTLNGLGGNDRIVGDRGGDTMNGGTGDDTLVWNNGDGTDTMNGDDGRDDIEVNGDVAQGDTFTVQPNAARVKFDRTNLIPFSLDIGSAETMHANGLGGNDSVTVGEVGTFEVTGSGGAGNDALTGAGSPETFLGGTGNDAINPGAGLDAVQGDDGDDTVTVRDDNPDVARGGDGTDSVVADTAALDILDGFEAVDRTPVVTPPTPPTPPVPPVVDTTTRPVVITGGTIKVSKGVAAVKVACPANSPANCAGKLTLLTKTVKIAGLKVSLQIASGRYNLAPGKSATLKLKLTKGVERLADKKGRLKVTAIADTGASGKIASSSRSITLSQLVVKKKK
jgi:Ca2+-binding RTX toxin-like protein